MNTAKKLADITQWMENTQRYIKHMDGNLIPHMEAAYETMRRAVEQEMVDLSALDSLVKTLKEMQQAGSTPLNGYDINKVVDGYRDLKQSLWSQRIGYLRALMLLEATLSKKLGESFAYHSTTLQKVVLIRSELDAVRLKINAVENQTQPFFKQRMIKETIELHAFYESTL